MKTIVIKSNSEKIQYLCNKDKRFAKLHSMIGDISYNVHEDEFSFLVHEIIEQMLSVQAGRKIFERLNVLCSGSISPKVISSLSQKDIKAIGTSEAKASYIKELAEAFLANKIDCNNLHKQSNEDVIKELTKQKGIGKWTAKMYLIFVLDRQDVIPYEDTAFIKTYKWLYNTNSAEKEEIKNNCEKWQPYASIVVRYMYRALDMGLTKEKIGL